MPISVCAGKLSRGSTRSSSASYSPKASSGSRVSFTSCPASLPSSASSTFGKIPPKPPCRYSRCTPSSSTGTPSQSFISYSRRTTRPFSIRMRDGEGLADLEDFLHMRLGTHVAQDVAHHALLVDHERGAGQAELRVPVHDLFLDHLVEAADFLLRTGEQVHREAVFVAERLVREHVVARDAEDDGVELLELVLAVGEADRLDGAAGRTVLGIEIKDDVLLPPVAGEIHHLHAGVGERE